MRKRLRQIYMDYAAATPVDPRVVKIMQKYFGGVFANPSSVHTPGVLARRAVEDSRMKIAEILKCRPSEITFTSGGTEGDNMAVLGTVRSIRDKVASTATRRRGGGHIITSAIEHHAVLSPVCVLESEGFDVTVLPVGSDGFVDPKDVKKALRPDTILVSIMYANNEIGTVQPIAEIAKVIRHWKSGAREFKLPALLSALPERADGLNSESATNLNSLAPDYPLLHIDACQAPGALPLNVVKLGVDLMTLSAAKMYGPKGVGCLYIKKGTPISPIIYGGGQEGGVRSGTENVSGIVGMAEALVIAERNREKEVARLTKLRNYFADLIQKTVPGAEVNGYLDTECLIGVNDKRLANNLNIYMPDVEAEQLVIELDAIGVSASAGSACHSSEASQGSHVIMALGYDKKRSTGSIRFSLGRSTTKKDIDFVLKSLPEIVARIKI